jgi:predicted nucleic-acid-binding protein
MRAVDTNLLVRIMVRDDPHQAARADRFIQSGGWVSLVVLAEAMWVLTSTYQRTNEDIAAVVEMLLKHEHLVFQDEDAVTAAAIRFRARPSLGFRDCLILELARKAGFLPLGTFDRRLAKVNGALMV